LGAASGQGPNSAIKRRLKTALMVFFYPRQKVWIVEAKEKVRS